MRVNLFGAISAADIDSNIEVQVFGTHGETGDKNLTRDQGQVIVADNQIMDSAGYGIVVEPDARGAGTNFAHPGSPAPLLSGATAGLLPGVSIINNVIAMSTGGGIHISGDPDNGSPSSASPFVKVVNNTIVGDPPPAPGSMADIVFLIDTTGSMTNKINAVKSQMAASNAVLVANGINAEFGLVRFPDGDITDDPTGNDALMIQDLTNFATFTAPGSPFTTLTADDFTGNEPGANAIREALNDAVPSTTIHYRPGATTVLILVTDDDDDSDGERATACPGPATSTPGPIMRLRMPI